MLDLFSVLGTCSKDNTACSDLIGGGVPGDIVMIVHYVYLGIQVIIPILLIIFGMIQLGKAVTAQKDDEIKAAQSSFLKKLIIAVIVFLVTSAVRFVFYFASGGANNDNKQIWGCVNSFLNGECGAIVPDTYE